MSVMVEHPNARDARQLRRAEIEHAIKCLWRDHTWIDPDGDLPILDYLRRVHYLGRTDRDRDRVLTGWLSGASVDPLKPVGELSFPERQRLIWAMVRFLKGERQWVA